MVRNTQDMCYLAEDCKKLKSGECTRTEKVYCERLHKIDALYELALIPEKHRPPLPLFVNAEHHNEVDFEAYSILKKEYLMKIEDFVSNGGSLIIYSQNCGNGKTEWAYKLLKGYIGRIWHKSDLVCRGLFVSVPRFFISLKENFSTPNEYAQYIKDNIIGADLVVFDEIGVKGLTEFEHEQLLNIINTRIEMGKANIYTSNLTPSDLSLSIGQRLTSRIINGATREIEFKGEDQRGINKIV